MPFSDSFRDTYLLGIKPACEEAGYYCERLDEQIFEETMLERIYNQIAKADLIVADLTERNSNVFYETGYAHALGKKVVLITRNSEDIPFDLKHHFHIVYSDGIAYLKRQLRDRASYYIAHPETSIRDPFEQFSLFINGELVDWRVGTIDIKSPLKLIGSGKEADFGISIDASFHLGEDAVESPLRIETRLITPPEFKNSGWENDRGPSYVYSIIEMPDGRIMHKAADAVDVSVGDPDKVVFDLYPETQDIEGKYPMVLRLFSQGLRRDLSLNVVI
jgi:hypothetical protein